MANPTDAAVSSFPPLVSKLHSSGSYHVVQAGTAANPPKYHQPCYMPQLLHVPKGMEAFLWLNENSGKEFIGVYRMGQLMSGHNENVLHGSITGLIMDEVLGAAATLTARQLSGQLNLAFMTRNLLTTYLRPVIVPNDLVVVAKVTGVERFRTEMDKVKDIEILGTLYLLKDWVKWREATDNGKDAKEPVALAKGRAEFSKVDMDQHMKRASKL
jgi:acyl-coenzyme A thioesterase PaaI-like protein